MGSLVTVVMLIYICFCFWVNFIVKQYFNQLFIQYFFVPQCPYINQMFEGNLSLHEQYATYDK